MAIFLIEHLGDAVISVPTLRAARNAFPEAHITLISSAIAAEFLANCPFIDEILVVETKRAAWWPRLIDSMQISKSLQKFDFELSIVPRDFCNDGFNELIAITTASKWKISLKAPELRWQLKPLKLAGLYDDLACTDETFHEAEYRTRTIHHLFPDLKIDMGLEAWLDAEDMQFAQSFFSVNGLYDVKDSIFVAIGLGASRAKRKWPVKSFAQLLDLLGKQIRLVPILVVGPGEAELAAEVARCTKQPVFFKVGASIRQSAALISKCRLFIGNDSGPMHIAASLGVPVVEISSHPVGADTRAVSSPTRFGPFGVPSRILQPLALEPTCGISGCRIEDAPHCITNIASETVLNAALDLLNSRSASGQLSA